MEEYLNPESQPQKVDTLANSDIMNNPFGDFMGKSTEITDMVMHPNQYGDILTNNLNTINNNLINNGTHDVEENFMQVENTQNFQPQPEESSFTLNDDNNNSNNNFNNSDLGPETNVDPDDDFSQNEELGEAAGGEKEKIQTEPKEIDDLNEIVPDICSGFDDDFTGACEDDRIEPTNNGEKPEESSETTKQPDTTDAPFESQFEHSIEVDAGKIDQIKGEYGDDFTQSEIDEDLPCEQSAEEKMQATFEAPSNNDQNEEDIGEEQFEQHQEQFEKHQEQFEQHQEQFEQHQEQFEQHQEQFEQRQEQFEKHQEQFEQHQEQFEQHQEQCEQIQVQFMHSQLENIHENVHLESAEAEHDELMESSIQEESICANEVNEEIQQQEQPLMTDLETIETAQEVVESDSSDDEWNYRKVEDNKEVDSIQTVEEHTEFSHQEKQEEEEKEIVESSIVVEEGKLVEEEEEETAPIEVADHIEQLEENLAESDNKLIEEQQQQQQEEEEEVYQEQNKQEIVEEIIQQVIVQDQEHLIESPIEVETDKDILQEKVEPVEEERHVLDDIEKDLQLEVDSEDTNDMDSQLNPEAKEFVPLSPVRNEFSSPPPENVRSPFINQILSGLGDAVVSQSPRKGDIPVMEDVQVPEENVFEKEADERAHEINLLDDNFQRIESPQEELNLKEAMQTDDKLEQGYKDDSQGFFEEEKIQTGDEYKELESSFDQYSNGFQSKIDDAMNRSFYEGRDNDILADPAKSILNTTQPLSDDEDSQVNKQQAQQQQKEDEIISENNVEDEPKPVVEDEKDEIDLLGSCLEPVNEQINLVNQFETLVLEKEPISQMESSDNFEAEKFVEEIKGINENFNKYVDTELSPTIPEAVSNVIQTVEETIFATHTSMKPIEDTNLDTFITETSHVSNLEDIITEQKQLIEEEMDIQEQEIQPEIEIKENIPEVIEQQVQQEELIPTMEAPAHEVTPPPVELPVQEPVVEEKLVEAVSEILESEKVVEEPQEDAKIESKVEEIVAAASIGIAAAAIGAAAVSKKSSTTSTKKPEAKKVTDVKVPSKPADVKKTDLKPKTAPTKTGPITAKPPASKPAPITRPSSSSTAASARPKSTTTLPPVAKKPSPISSSTPKPTEAKPKADAPKPARPASTLTKRPAASAPASKPAPAKPTTEVKPKVNGTTERKPLSSAPTTRAPVKPTSLTVKSASATTAKSPSAPKPTARLSLSSIEKSASSPLKDKSLNKSLTGPTTAAKSPRTVTSTSTTKTAVKTDIKSPSAAKPSVGVIGTKKPLTTVKKVSPTTEKISTMTVTKKPAAKPSLTGVKKTTTTSTTVIRKKVVNGDIVEESKKTTTTESESAEDVPALNGHHMNGNAENGVSHEIEQQAVIEPTAN